METPAADSSKSTKSPSSREIAASGGNLADLLAAAGNGIRITGLVLAADPVKEFKGTSKTGNPYAFAVQEMQMFTGNKAVLVKFQGDIGDTFPDVRIGEVRTFKITNVRMNGTNPVFELSTEE